MNKLQARKISPFHLYRGQTYSASWGLEVRLVWWVVWMVVVREQERVARYRMRSIYINGNHHVMGRSWPLQRLIT